MDARNAVRKLNLQRTWIRDLSPLADCPLLEVLNLNDTSVTDLTPLSGLTQLSQLFLARSAVNDLTPIAKLPLRELYLDGTPVRDLQPLASLETLEKLVVPNVFDYGPIRSLPNLDRVSTRWVNNPQGPAQSREEFFAEIEAAAPHLAARRAVFDRVIAGLNATGARSKSGVLLSDLVVISPEGWIELSLPGESAEVIANLRGQAIESLDLERSQIEDLSPVAQPALRKLNLAYTKVKDIAPLAVCRQLEWLRLSSTQVEDLTPIARAPLKTFILGGSKVASFEPLRRLPLRAAALLGNATRDISPLADCSDLENLAIDPNAQGVEKLRNLPKLRYLGNQWDRNNERPQTTAAEFWAEYDSRK